MMKKLPRKVLPGIVMAAVMLASGTASAASVNCGMVGATPICTDMDGDMTVNINSLSGDFPKTTTYDITEFTVNGKDIYNIGFNWDSASGFANGYSPAAPGGDITYTVTSSNRPYNGVNLDTGVYVSGTAGSFTQVVKDVSVGGVTVATLTSLNGSRDPTIGEVGIAPSSVLTIHDTFTQNNGVFLHAENSISAVPEPAESALMLSGLGLLGFIAARSRRNQGMTAS